MNMDRVTMHKVEGELYDLLGDQEKGTSIVFALEHRAGDIFITSYEIRAGRADFTLRLSLALPILADRGYQHVGSGETWAAYMQA
jgi:hypothetical protein